MVRTKIIVIVKIKVKMMMKAIMKVECISVIVRLVSITPGHVKLD
jgi:hypothetical protein